MEKWLFCLVAMARLGKYCMGGYGVYGMRHCTTSKLRTFCKLPQNLYICTGQNHGPFLGKLMDPR